MLRGSSRANDRRVPPMLPRAESFRDPDGRLMIVDDRVIRAVRESASSQVCTFLSSSLARELIGSGRVVGTRILGDVKTSESRLREAVSGLSYGAEFALLLEHDSIFFPSYPYEWPADMLREAGRLTLDLAESLVEEGFGLKDATPYNILFQGPTPVFVDLLSVERRDPRDPVWLPYGQFLRTFVLPMIAHRYFGIELRQIFIPYRDGLEPESVYRLCGPLQKLLPPFITEVSLPTWLGAKLDPKREDVYQPKRLDSQEKAKFVLRCVLRQLRRALDRAGRGHDKDSPWSDYMCSKSHYSDEAFAEKQRFVEDAITEFSSRKVLDVGCNTGYFSSVACRNGAQVVAIDYDPVVVGRVWRMACKEGLNILPLVTDLTRPSPAIGWRNEECRSFLERARGSFDTVFMLAVLHHMLVTERVPLPQIIDLAASLTTNVLLMEFVPPEDPMFRVLLRGRAGLFNWLTREFFELSCASHFDVIRSSRLGSTNRWLYLLRRKRAS